MVDCRSMRMIAPDPRSIDDPSSSSAVTMRIGRPLCSTQVSSDAAFWAMFSSESSSSAVDDSLARRVSSL
jgi:hypothetical protein